MIEADTEFYMYKITVEFDMSEAKHFAPFRACGNVVLCGGV